MLVLMAAQVVEVMALGKAPLVVLQRQVRDTPEGLERLLTEPVEVEVDQPRQGETEHRVVPAGLVRPRPEVLEHLIVLAEALSITPLAALVVTGGIPPLTAPAHLLRMEQDGLTLTIEGTVVLLTILPITRLDHLVL